MAEPLDLASWEPEYSGNPYPFFARLREQGPVTQVVVEGLAVWLVTRYDDIRAGLCDPRLSNDPELGDAVTCAVPWVGASVATARHLLRVDPPDHTRLRRLVARAFTPRRIEALRPRIQQIADSLIAAIQPLGSAEMLDAFALPLPLIVISELFGVPTPDRQEFVQWANLIFGVDQGDGARIVEARAWVTRYLAELIRRKEHDRAGLPADAEQGCLLDGLIAARDEGDRLSHTEMVAMSVLLVVAGFETTVNLIANGLVTLLQHPAQYAALCADPGLVRPAVEEFLRHESPVKITPFVRITTAPVTLGGVEIPAQQPVLFAFGAGNRDPAQFPDPDRFDIARGDGHLAFGHGIHFCLGAPLARLEAEIAFTTLLAGCPDLALAVDPARLEWRHSRSLRALKRLPVTFSPRAAARRADRSGEAGR
ncbi:MAG TPA: cytochrome P450 [Kofleriaceae bacterium]|nr:cytochrome P450 [Kofleriaceae bacterium]